LTNGQRQWGDPCLVLVTFFEDDMLAFSSINKIDFIYILKIRACIILILIADDDGQT
jgi:hypothetical protein